MTQEEWDAQDENYNNELEADITLFDNIIEKYNAIDIDKLKQQEADKLNKTVRELSKSYDSNPVNSIDWIVDDIATLTSVIQYMLINENCELDQTWDKYNDGILSDAQTKEKLNEYSRTLEEYAVRFEALAQDAEDDGAPAILIDIVSDLQLVLDSLSENVNNFIFEDEEEEA